MSTTIMDRPTLRLAAGPRAVSQPGHIDVLADEQLLALLDIEMDFGGADRGTNTQSDIVTRTTDGVDLAGVWAEFQQVLDDYNQRRSGLVNFLTYNITNEVETVMVPSGEAEFEVASEFGVPKGVRTRATYYQMGFPFEWYDVAGRFTWKYLIGATAAQVESVHQAIIEADNRLVFGEVMKTLFNKANRVANIEDRAYTVYGLYNNDGTVPPPFKSTTFTGSHDHYMVSGAAVLDAGDLDALIGTITEHGFGPSNDGSSIVVMVNKQESAIIRNFRSKHNLGNGLTAGEITQFTGTYDFIPAQGTPTLLLPRDMVVGSATQPPAQLAGFKVIGSYGDATIVEEDYIPAGYLVAFATGGSQSLTNPLGIRQHANTGLRGLRLVKGRDNDYPLQESYYQRGFGVGIRQRGSAALMQIKASGTFDVPAAYVR